ncbi:MAG: aminoacyl-tRNA deacylase [Alphaproteobacteria bacterium]
MMALDTTLAPKLKAHLDTAGVYYDVHAHPWAPTASEAAQAAHVPGDRLAKAVLLQDGAGPVLAVLSSTHQVSEERAGHALDRSLELAPEDQIAVYFADCAPGAVPALGAAYGVETVVDRSLDTSETVYFEAGDHKHLVAVSGGDFHRLLGGARWESFSVRR